MRRFVSAVTVVLVCGGFVLAETRPVFITEVTSKSVTILVDIKVGARQRKTFTLARNARIYRLKDSKTSSGKTVKRKARRSDLQDAIDYHKRGRGMGVNGVLKVTGDRVTEIGFYARTSDEGAYFRSLSRSRSTRSTR
jgi:hypothetical protein